MKENILGTEKVQKLLIKFSLPAIISMLVNSLYNIVDQLFIGNGVGYLGNGATTIIFPITMVCSAIACMIGDGAASYLSLKLGENKKDEASNGVFSAFISSLFISILIFILVFCFLDKIIVVFGCTPDIKPYALSYGRWITVGLPFTIISTVLNSIIRADGSPKYSMISMISGAVINCILDPIFIFGLKLGVVGAALATVIAQVISFTINILYLGKFKSIDFGFKKCKYDFKKTLKISMLGISSLITQLSIVAIMAVENNTLGALGAASKFGPNIPMIALGIVMKISQILNSIIIGLAAGSQPIIGFNYGAGKYDRVKSTFKYVLGFSIVISTLALVLFQTIPEVLISAFGKGDALYIEFACMAFRTYLLLTILNGVQIPSSIFFQAIGKSKKSAILSLSRQVLLLIPAMIIFGKVFGINGVLYAGPFADLIAFIISIILLILEFKHLNKNSEDVNTSVIKKKSQYKGKHVVITIGREYGSGGRFIGELVASGLNINFYDKNLIEELSYETGYSKEYIEKNEQSSIDEHSNGFTTNSDELFIKESELIKNIAKNESCVIVGRCANAVLKDNKDVVNVFIYNSDEGKVDRAVKYYGLNKKTALKEIKKINRQRAKHYKTYTDMNWNDFSNYDLCINSDVLGVIDSAKLIIDFVSKKDK